MLIGVPRERRLGETRVAATPKTVGQLIGLGYEVVIEAGAGVASAFTDESYRVAGATVGTEAESWGADIVFHVNPPSDDEIAMLRSGATLVSLMSPALQPAWWASSRTATSRPWPWTPFRASRGRSRSTC